MDSHPVFGIHPVHDDCCCGEENKSWRELKCFSTFAPLRTGFQLHLIASVPHIYNLSKMQVQLQGVPGSVRVTLHETFCRFCLFPAFSGFLRGLLTSCVNECAIWVCDYLCKGAMFHLGCTAFQSHAQHSRDRLWSHLEPVQDKAVTEDKRKAMCIKIHIKSTNKSQQTNHQGREKQPRVRKQTCVWPDPLSFLSLGFFYFLFYCAS